MKYTAHLCLIAVVAALVSLTSCTTTLLDYTVTGVNLSKVEFDATSDYAAYTADRDFYYMRAMVQPVHTKRSLAASIRPYPNGCVDRITAVNFESADHRNVNASLCPMPVGDGRLYNVKMGQPGKESLIVFHYDSADDIVQALQTGYDPRCVFLVSMPKGSQQPSRVNITMADRSVSSPGCGQLAATRIDEITYTDATGAPRTAPKAKSQTAQPSHATTAEVSAVNAAVERIYGDICAHPEVHAELYSRATEQYCTSDFKALLSKALKAHPDDEEGPLSYDYWLMTQEDLKASYKITGISPGKESGSYNVFVTLADHGYEYAVITLVMKKEGDAWKIDDFITAYDLAKVSVRTELTKYIKNK